MKSKQQNTQKTNQRRSELLLEEAAQSLTDLNKGAKGVKSPAVRQLLYGSKHTFLNYLIERFANTEQLRLSYQRFNETTFLLVTINTRPKRTFHLPIDFISASAEQCVIYEIGTADAWLSSIEGSKK